MSAFKTLFHKVLTLSMYPDGINGCLVAKRSSVVGKVLTGDRALSLLSRNSARPPALHLPTADPYAASEQGQVNTRKSELTDVATR